MKNKRAFLATLMAVVLFFTGLSAYACLVPINDDVSSILGLDCPRPSEDVAQPFCDTFKMGVVHKTPEVTPTTASDIMPTCEDSSLVCGLKVASVHHGATPFGAYAPSPDILLLISVLRI
ncbi:MAG: hypothetical protein NPIRA01_31110 [Nitrospirales bacterium]|nr:MAG: hypothetical protein NPIRA01_31110 [Nitrospirales bacterium]